MKKNLRIPALCLTFLFVVTVRQANAQDTWNRKADVGGGIRFGAVGFSIGKKAYIGTGAGVENNNAALKNDFWEYDPVSNTWSQKADFPGGRRYHGTGMAIGNKGYVGMGFASFNTNKTRDFWQYDPVKNAWQKKASFPGPPTSYTANFSIGNKGYVGTGRPDGASSTKQFWEYDAVKNKWTRKADFSGPARFAATGFSIGKRGYIGIGELGSERVVFLVDFWEYNPVTDKWTQRAPFKGGGRRLGTGFSIGKKGYMGLGSILGLSVGDLKNDFWEYDPTYNTWTQKPDYPGGTRQMAVGFSIHHKGYIGTGGALVANVGRVDFWEFNPGIKKKRSIVRVTIPGTSNPWLAGMPDGTTSDLGDFAPANSPVLIELQLWRGAHVEISEVTGMAAHGNEFPYTGPEGCLTFDPCYITNLSHDVGAEYGKSDLTAPINSLVGVFLNDKIPTYPAPPALDFSTPKSRDYLKLYPKLKQVFFIGNGKTTKGVQQEIIIPAGATRLYLGMMDGIEWTGNSGAFEATVKVVPHYFRKRFNHHHEKKPDYLIGHASVLDEESAEPVRNSFVVKVAPNPFRSVTRIQYEIPDDGHVSIAAFDAYGRLIRQLANSNHLMGVYTVDFDGSGLANGIYYFQVKHISKLKEVHITTNKIVLMK